MFDDSQQYVIDSNEYPLMCFAGPGSGKTRTLLGKAYKLAFDKNRKGNILILCFNKAIKEEIEEKLNEQGLTRYGVEVKTLHAAGLKFIMEAFGKGNRLRLNYLTASQNRTFYYGDDQKNIPGLMNTLLKMFGGNPIRTLFENRILSEINVLAANFLLECSAYPPFEMKVKHSRHFHSFTVLVAKLLRLATVTPKPENFVSQYAKFITEDFFSIIDRTRKQKNFIKYFIKLFYTGEFVPYVHNCLLNFASKGDLFGRYANAELDVIPPFVPKIFLYLNDLELENLPYSKYADLFLTPELGSLIQSASLKQLLEWNQLDYDQMISLGAVAMQKIKPNYYAVLVDEAQDLTLHDWYLTYEMAPKYLITDQSKRLLYVGDLMQACNRWRYASADRFAEYSKKHAYKQLEFSYRCPDIIVAKANNIKNRSSMVHPEGEFRSAAKDQPGMFSVLPEMIKPEDLEDFLNNQGLRMSDLAILARTNMDLLSWQVWAVIRDIPIAEMYVNKWNIDTPSMRLLLALICLADRSSSTENVGIASFVLNNIKDDPLCAKRFTEQLDKIAPDLEEELILKWFSCLLLKDEEDLTEEEMAEVLMGKGAVTMLRAWYAGDKFSLKSDYVQYLRQKDYQIRKHPSGLTLSTIHRFKGKEKNAVLIFSNAWGRMTEKAMNDGKRRQIEEELALAYVAVSRARKAAFLSGNVHPDLY